MATLRQLRLFDVGTELPRGDLCLPTLDEYISICKKYEKAAVLELKNRMPDEAVWEIAEIVADHGYMENTVFISFSLDNLIALRAKYPRQKAQYLVSKINDPKALLETLKAHRLDLDAKHTALTRELVEQLHAEGVEVNVWTVDTPEDAARVMAMGVDYITSNILE